MKPEITQFGIIHWDDIGGIHINGFSIEGNGSYEDPKECLIRLIIETLQAELVAFSRENQAKAEMLDTKTSRDPRS